MGSREPLAWWVRAGAVSLALPVGQIATFKVFISQENANGWWECHESGKPWPFGETLFDEHVDAQLAAEDAARDMVAAMAAALGGSVTWGNGRSADDVLADESNGGE